MFILKTFNKQMKNKKIIIYILILLIILPFSKVDSASIKPTVNSHSAILIDANSDYVLYEKNSNEKVYPASTTKILTSIIILENCDLNKIVTVSKSAISQIPSGYSSAYLSEGEEISIKDLVTLFLVHSANDAGYVLAEYYSENIQSFAKVMNEKVKEIGCINTNFTNPSGIHDDNHYTTAYDLSLIAKYCMKNEIFRSIVSQKSCTISPTNKYGIREYKNTNDLLNTKSKYYISDCIGIKTGYTKEAQNCLISAFNKDNLELICVVLGSSSAQSGESERYVDTTNLYNYGYTNYSIKNIVKKGNVVKTIEIPKATKETKDLNLIVENDINALINVNESIPEAQITIKNNLSAPIEQGENIGIISYTINNVTYSQNLLAENKVLKNNTLRNICLLIFLLIILFLIFTLILKYRKKNKRRNKYRIHY